MVPLRQKISAISEIGKHHWTFNVNRGYAARDWTNGTRPKPKPKDLK